MKPLFEGACNVPDGYGITSDRLWVNSHKPWKLYFCDHFWVLDIDEHLEFYYHPEHGLGKIRKNTLPKSVFEELNRQCVVFDSRGGCYWQGVKIQRGMSKPICTLRNVWGEFETRLLGNWFHGQGNTYLTQNGKLYDDFSNPGTWTEWNLWDVDLDLILSMYCSTRTHHFIRRVWDLECFRGVDHSELILKPFTEDKWDSNCWKDRFKLCAESNLDDDRTFIRFMRQDVFLHTVFLARQKWYYSEQGKQVQLPDPDMTMEGTTLYSKRFSMPKTAQYKTVIRVENIDCLTAAQEWKRKGYRVAVLNMASRQNPGGGVYSGAGAQEENIFRRTNIFQSLFLFAPYAEDYGLKMRSRAYPLDRNYGGIYSPEVTVFRGLEKDGYPLLEDPFNIDFISVPGMNKPALNREGLIEDKLVEGVKNKMRTIFEIALQNQIDCLILGAFGCGAFKNPPQHIAKLFHELLQNEYRNEFRIVVFSILEDHNSGKYHNREGNYKPFLKEFQDSI